MKKKPQTQPFPKSTNPIIITLMENDPKGHTKNVKDWLQLFLNNPKITKSLIKQGSQSKDGNIV